MKSKILIQDDVYGEYCNVFVNGTLEFTNPYPEPPISYLQLMEIICKYYDIDCEVQMGQFIGDDFRVRDDRDHFKSR